MRHNANEPIAWDDSHQNILEEMIDLLKSPEVIAYPNFELPFFMTCDASNRGLGAVLYQTQEGVDRVISYASRTLSNAEQNYHMHSGKLEFLAMKWAITERFADYLRYGPPFVVYTDNNPLTYVLTTAKLNAVGQRWVNELADFNFEIRYKPGKENVDADFLSRQPRDINEFKGSCTEKVPAAVTRDVKAWVDDNHLPVMAGMISVNKLTLDPESEVVKVSAEELRVKQTADEVIGPVVRAVTMGSRPSRKEWGELSSGSKLLMRDFRRLFLRDGVLWRRTAKFQQLVLPKDFHQTVYVELHEKLAHLGVEKVLDLAQQRFYWPRMATDIKNYIQKRCRCVANKKPVAQERAPLVPMEATHPFQIVAIDYMALDKCKGGYRYAMVVTDHFTRFCQIYATRTKSSKAAAEKLFNEFIMQFGYPERIHHDQGPEFNSKLFAELHRLTRIKASNTTPYHPEGNGQAERFNRTVCNMLKTLSKPAKLAWNKQLPKLAFAYNSTINKTTGFSPMRLMFGRESRLPIDLLFDVRKEEMPRQTWEQFVQEWQESMQEAVRVAQENIRKSAEYNKKLYDGKVKAVEVLVGDLVLVKNVREKGGTGKLKSYWEEAIFKVIEKKDGLPVYKIKNLRKAKDVRTVHRNLLMKCDELPLNVFDDEEERKKKKKTPKRTEVKEERNETETTPAVQVEDEESDDVTVILRVEEPLVQEVRELPEDQLGPEDAEEVIIPDDAVEEGSVMVEESPEEDEVEELSDTHDGDESNGTDVEDSSEDRTSDEEEVAQLRRTNRESKSTKFLTYDELGEPTYVDRTAVT